MASDARGARRAKRAKFADDLKPMLFGFGDDAVPFDDTVSLVEDIVIDFIKSVVRCRFKKLTRCILFCRIGHHAPPLKASLFLLPFFSKLIVCDVPYLVTRLKRQ